MSQLRIEYEILNDSSTKNVNDASLKGKNTPPSSPALKVLRGEWSECSLARKARKLKSLRPKLAAVIEGLVDDMLDEIEGRRP